MRESWRGLAAVALVAALIVLGCIVSPPALMDDVDAVQASIARTMLESGDWVTPKLNGVRYLEKPPLKYWLIAASFAVFGPHDWAARLPIALGIVGLCVLVAWFGRWAFGAGPGMWAGLMLATSVGLWLFSRILIADPLLTLAVTAAMFGFLRALDPEEARPGRWSALGAAGMAAGMLFKGLISAVFPLGTAVLYLLVTGLWRRADTWRRLRPVTNAALVIGIAAPWHVAAMLANPPYFDFTLASGPGHYRGFFWFYFFNEHVFRFLNLRYPRDYNTVPRHLFFLYHLLWLFPWPGLFAAIRGPFLAGDRASRTRLLALVWTAFVLLFFSFSTTQEYYSMPCYPALALLLADAMHRRERAAAWGLRAAGTVAALALVAVGFLLSQVWNMPVSGDISQALARQPTEAYTLALGHAGDLTLRSFAYLKTPLLLAGAAFGVGAVGALMFRSRWALVAMMIVFFHAARLALVVFEPYLSSRELAVAYRQAPPGELIVDDQYYTFSSVFFYANTEAWLLGGRVNNLEYGSNAPDAPRVFWSDERFVREWTGPKRYYLATDRERLRRIAALVPVREVRAAGGRILVSNR